MNNQRIKEAIASERVKIVSFDIFDTLLSRPCLAPTQLFRIMGKRGGFCGDYESIRRKAEVTAREKRPAGEDDVTLDAIFRELAAVIGEDAAAQLKQIEMQTEADYLYPRRPLEEAYHYARSLGKQVIIVSDMYLPAQFLARVLEKNGYTGFRKLYVSNEYRMTKGSKRLFHKVLADLAEDGIAPSEILHIGDNYSADIRNPSECGMQTFYVESGTQVMRNSELIDTLTEHDEDGCLLGLAANTFFDPFRKEDSDARAERSVSGLVKRLMQCGEAPVLDRLALLFRDRVVRKELQIR